MNMLIKNILVSGYVDTTNIDILLLNQLILWKLETGQEKIYFEK